MLPTPSLPIRSRRAAAGCLFALALLAPARLHAQRAGEVLRTIHAGKQDRVRYVGDRSRPDNTITNGLEAEFVLRDAPAIAEHYRRQESSPEEWKALSPEERLARAGQLPSGNVLLPLDGAPRAFALPATHDVAGLEVISVPMDTLAKTFEALDQVEALTGNAGKSRSKAFYWQGNVVFKQNPRFVRKNLGGMMGYLKVSADYAQLKKLDDGYLHHLEDPSFIPGANLVHGVLPPMTVGLVENERTELAAAADGRSSGATSGHHVQGTYFRTWAYGDGNVGFEVRDGHKDIAHLQSEMRRVTTAIEHDFAGYRRFRGLHMLDEDRDFVLLSEDVRAMLSSTRDGAARFRPENYSFPLRPFEDDYVTALRLKGDAATSFRKKIVSARAEYVAALEELADDPAPSGATRRDRIHVALARFVHDSGLYQAIDESIAHMLERESGPHARKGDPASRPAKAHRTRAGRKAR